jgi:SPP1 gp7 family putative phage head morphogenesis protein
MQDLNKRLLILKGRILKLIVEEDAFGLKRINKVDQVVNTRWRFQSDPDKRRLFISWLQEQQDDLGLTSLQEPEDVWLEKYIQKGFEKGSGRAFDDTKKPALASNLDFYEGTRSQFLQSSFRRPEAINKVKLLAGRTFDDLRGVSQAMSTQISRELVDGLIAGNNPREIAKSINKTVDKIGKNRANTIARTEVIRAHAEGQLDALEQLGVETVGVAVEWSTAGDDRVCPLCSPLEGIVMTLKEAKGTIPRHPNCRCAYLPAIPDVKGGETRPQQIRAAIDESISRERKKGTLATKKAASSWPGADKKIAQKRPLGGKEIK